ncbi:MAG: hypothetical protein JWO38_7970 [Gemmataceae bacterium]|nr:hypothetical protein [Gemmataceae bacterium]
MSSRTGVRVTIVGIFALMATAVTVAEVRSQPGRPGFNRPGGITGMPGRPGGITGMPGGVPGGGFRGPQFEDVWYCGGCKAELGRGPIKPSYASCPKCGVRFVNGGGPGPGLFNPPTMPGGPGMPGAPGGGESPPTPAPPTDPDLVPRTAPGTSSGIGVSTTPTFPPSGVAPSVSSGPGGGSDSQPSSSTSSTSSDSGSKTGSLILKIMIGVFGVLFLLGIVGGTILIISANKAQKAPPRRRRKALDLDDDDD